MPVRLLAFAILFALFVRCVEGSELIVDVISKDGTTMYAFNGKSVTFQELTTWMQEVTAKFGGKDPIYVRLDPDISFLTIFELARMLTSSGVQTVKIFASEEKTPTQIISRSMAISREQIIEEKRDNISFEIMKRQLPLDKEQKDTNLPMMSAVGLKCTTSGRIKVHHFGRSGFLNGMGWS